MRSPFEQVVDARSGMLSLLRKLPGGVQSHAFSIQIDFELSDGEPGSYRIALATYGDHSVALENERCIFGEHWFESNAGLFRHNVTATPAISWDRPGLVAMGGLPEFAQVFDLLSGMAFYAPQPESMRRPAAKGSGKLLLSNGSNAADVLARLERVAPGLLARIRGYLTSFNPEFGDVIPGESNDHRWLTFQPSGNPVNWRLNSSDVSDGTLRAAAILLAVFQAAAPDAHLALVGLEEPESALHPAAAGVLLDALLEASEHVQVIASTHSADLLDRRDVAVDSLVAFSMQNGESIIGPIDEPSREILRRRLYTAGDLLRNNQLSPAIAVPQR